MPKARSCKGGNASHLKSLEPGQLTKSERGKRGGAPSVPTYEDLRRMDGQGAQNGEVGLPEE